ncbi:YegP family protein, partial [Pseudomonas sp. JAI120]|uniref:YegP family protein n=1 Tax=Pseudomonas sp. JAI120 TaxID=2723063 RepID=UPI0030ECF445
GPLRGAGVTISPSISLPHRQTGEVSMAHKFVIEQNKAGESVAKFKYHSELIWWTEGYSSKAGAKNAIESVLKNGPGAPVEEA